MKQCGLGGHEIGVQVHIGNGSPARGPKVYLSSGLGFTEGTQWWYDSVVIPRLEKAGFELLDPWRENGRATEENLSEADQDGLSEEERWEVCIKIAQRNIRQLTNADAVLAFLDGSDVDSGVACEVGWAAAVGIPVVGLRTDRRHYSDSSGSKFNLQVQYAVLLGNGEAEGAIATSLEEAVRDLKRLAKTRSAG